MGCWNETCGLSQKSISYGELVYAVIILNENAVYKSCYANGMAKPFSFLIEGTYDDYGSIENIKDTFATKSLILLFNELINENKLVISEEVAKQNYFNNEEIGYDGEKFTSAEAILKFIERGYLSLSTNSFGSGKSEQTFSFMLFDCDAYDAMKEVIEYREVKYIDLQYDVQEFLNTLVNNNSNLNKTEIREKLKDDNLSDEEKDTLIELLFQDRNSLWGGEKLKSKASKWGNMLSYLRSYESVDRHAFGKLEKIVRSSYTLSSNDEINKTISDFIITLLIFNIFRKNWAPQGHASQDDNLIELIDFTERFLRKLYRKRDILKEEGYYEDEHEVIGGVSILDEKNLLCNS